MKNNKRVSALDCMRGIAILMVLGFHAYACYPSIVPWATVHAEFPLFGKGYLGVELFFLISGFVIYLTLENCQSFGQFLYRRWLRLFPAMLIASLLIFATASLLPQRPAGTPKLLDVLPGLLFVEPRILGKLIGTNLLPLESAFWSLFVELKFYVIFGALYFLRPEAAIRRLIYLAFLYAAFHLLAFLHPSERLQNIDGLIVTLTSLNYFGWFVLGALAYKYKNRVTPGYVAQCAMVAVPSFLLTLPPLVLLSTGTDVFLTLVGCLIVYLFFVLVVHWSAFAKLVENRFFLLIGFVSYPMYLIHESALVSLTVVVHDQVPALPDMLTPLPGFLLILALSYLIAKFGEPLIKGLLLALVRMRTEVR